MKRPSLLLLLPQSPMDSASGAALVERATCEMLARAGWRVTAIWMFSSGFIAVAGQSLLITRRAPCAARVAAGYIRRARSGPSAASAGAISGPDRGSEGSLFELWAGERFLADGDEVVLRAHGGDVALGEVRGRVVGRTSA